MSTSAHDSVDAAEESPQARSDVLYRELADGGLIYDSTSKHVHHLNETAALVWRACQRGAHPGEMVEELIGKYVVDKQQALTDVHAAVQRLRDGGLLLAPATGKAPLS